MTHEELTAMEELGVVPDSKDVFGRKAAQFDRLVADLAEAQEAKKAAETTISECKKKLETLFVDSDHKTILSNGSRVTYVLSSNSQLDKKMLLEAGVPAATIVACTKTTSYSFVKVTAPKEPK